MNLKIGDVFELDDGRDYACISIAVSDGITYGFFSTLTQPLEVRFVKVSGDSFEIIYEPADKEKALEAFKNLKK